MTHDNGPMRVLGIDPGLATVGIGCIDCANARDVSDPRWLTIETPAGLPIAERLLEIQKDLTGLLTEWKPDLVVIEKLFFATNAKTALDVAHARGVLVLTVAQHGIEILEATPLQLKLGITGDGGADKLQVQTMLKHMLNLTEIPHPDDAADALALAVYGALQNQRLANSL